MAGKPWTESQKEAARVRMLGKSLPLHHRAAISASQRGRVVSDETRSKIGDANRLGPETCFWPFVLRRSSDECWPWGGKVDGDGYGVMTIRSESSAARYSFRLHNGIITRGLVVRHTCDNPPCVNPRHLISGTHADNVRDCIERGRRRYAFGSSNGATRLREEDVRAIKHLLASGVPRAAIRSRFGIGSSTLHAIVTRRTWAHI